MTNRMQLVAAGNTLAPALGILRELGYTVTRVRSPDLSYRAENETCIFIADDLLALLGLVKIYEVRGLNWQPNDAEVQDILLLENGEE
jgi:hypothetical protein